MLDLAEESCLTEATISTESDQTIAKDRCVASDSNFLREMVVGVEHVSRRFHQSLLTYAFLMLREIGL